MSLSEYDKQLNEIENELLNNVKEYEKAKWIEGLSILFDFSNFTDSSDILCDPIEDTIIDETNPLKAIGLKLGFTIGGNLIKFAGHSIKTQFDKAKYKKEEKERLYQKAIRMLFAMLEMHKKRLIKSEERQDEIEKKLTIIIENIGKQNG